METVYYTSLSRFSVHEPLRNFIFRLVCQIDFGTRLWQVPSCNVNSNFNYIDTKSLFFVETKNKE